MAVQQALTDIAKSKLSSKEKGAEIKRFLAETYFPDFPGMTSFCQGAK